MMEVVRRKHVYVAGPYRGDNGWEVELNIRRAEVVGMEIAEDGHVPVIPHTMYRFFDRTCDDQFWIDATLSLMHRCDAVFLCEGWERSEGSLGERAAAVGRNMPCFTSLPDLRVWLRAED